MGTVRRRYLRDEEVEEELINHLDDSDLENNDPFSRGRDDDDEDEDYRQENIEEDSSSSSSSNSDIETTQPNSNQRSRGQGRARGRSRNRRGTRVQRQSRGRNALSRSPLPLRDDPVDDDENEWIESPMGEYTEDPVPLTEPAYLPTNRDTYDKIDYLREYIDHATIENLVDKTNRSYLARTGKVLNLSVAECNTYIAMSMITSVINYPSLRMYWSKKFRVPIIANNMARNRFFLLRRSLKLVLDEDVPAAEKERDKLWKVRPLIDRILKGCKLQEKTKDLSVDEMIIPFQGACGLKQYCPGKPNPVGLKAFVLAAPNGLVCNFDIYQGTTTYPTYVNRDLGLGEKSVLHLVEDLVPGHIIYCDRYFTSEKLVLALQEKGLMCSGTINKNRIPKSARRVLLDDKIMKKKNRGSFQVVVNKAKKLVITKWLDSKPITLMSNVHADQTLDSCQRWSKKEKKYITVTRPQVVKLYNTNMGGVDLTDRMLAVCPNRYRTNKWTQRFISHMIDLAVTNSWILFKQDKLNKGARLHTIPQLRMFKLEIAETILDANIDTDHEDQSSHDDSNDEQPLNFRRVKVPVPIPSEKDRTRGAMHLPELGAVQHKCRQIACKKKTKMMCTKCNIYLCITHERNCLKTFIHLESKIFT